MWHMIKILLTVAVLGSVDGFAGLAMAQGIQAFGSEVSSQCAHRRVMGPDPHNDCFRRLRSDAHLGYGQAYYGQAYYGQANASARSSDHRDEPQPIVSREQPIVSREPPVVIREQPETSTPPKVATVPAPKPKKASTPPRIDAQKEQQLYQEFLEWRNRRLFYAATP
jgi:hypothetical protein